MLRGAPRLYGYQLINNNAEDFALLNSNGSPRLQFTALKNLIALFKDPGAAFVPDRLAYTLSGVSTGIQQMLFQKRDGRFYLAVWQGVLSSSLTSSDSGIRDVEPARRALTFESRHQGHIGQDLRALALVQPREDLRQCQRHRLDPVERAGSCAGDRARATRLLGVASVIEGEPRCGGSGPAGCGWGRGARAASGRPGRPSLSSHPCWPRRVRPALGSGGKALPGTAGW